MRLFDIPIGAAANENHARVEELGKEAGMQARVKVAAEHAEGPANKHQRDGKSDALIAECEEYGEGEVPQLAYKEGSWLGELAKIDKT